MASTVYIILTNKCNKKCDFCFYAQEAIRKKPDKLSLGKLSIFLAEAKKNNFNEITLTGGEPLLRKELFLSLIDLGIRLGMQINIDTNGSLLNNQLIDSLKKKTPLNIYLSSRGILEKQISLNKVERLANKFCLTIIHVITKRTLRDLAVISDIASKLKVPLILQPAYISDDYSLYKSLSLHELNSGEISYFADNFGCWAEKNKKNEYKDLIFGYYSINNTILEKPKACHMGKDDLVVDSDGSVYPCFHRLDLLCGNISDDKTKAIFQKAMELSKKTHNAECFGEHCLSLFC